MAGVKDAIENGQLNVKLLDICPGFSGEEKENCTTHAAILQEEKQAEED